MGKELGYCNYRALYFNGLKLQSLMKQTRQLAYDVRCSPYKKILNYLFFGHSSQYLASQSFALKSIFLGENQNFSSSFSTTLALNYAYKSRHCLTPLNIRMF